jgi:hypothetical protein
MVWHKAVSWSMNACNYNCSDSASLEQVALHSATGVNDVFAACFEPLYVVSRYLKRTLSTCRFSSVDAF